MDLSIKLRSLLHQYQLLPCTSPEASQIFNKICKLVFDEKAYKRLWDESVLSQLEWLFHVNPPEQSIFGDQLGELLLRVEKSHHVNNLFFHILNRNSTLEEIFNAACIVFKLNTSMLPAFKASDRLDLIRQSDSSPYEKVRAFLEFVGEDLKIEVTNQESLNECLEVLKTRGNIGVVNTLLVKEGGAGAIVVSLEFKTNNGSGQVHNLAHGRTDFEATVKRSRFALQHRGFLKDSADVFFTLELTEPEYHGTSIGLAACVGMYAEARGMVIDPYTAFTGDINLDGGNWRVKGVSGLSQKLDAAQRYGIRRVFIPSENFEEVTASSHKQLQVIPVNDLLEVFLQLQTSLDPLPGDSVQVRKINRLQAFCQAEGWDLSPPKTIQNGLQFRVAPFSLPELTVTIYTTGSHLPKGHTNSEYQSLLNNLEALEESNIPIRKIERSFNLPDSSLRAEVRQTLEGLQPSEKRDDPHCEFFFKFEQGKENITVKQYKNGKIQFQGSAGKLYKSLLENVIPRYKLHYPNAKISVEEFLQIKEEPCATSGKVPVPASNKVEIPLPHIGTDESGKGDYFGPMVVAGVLVDAPTKQKLEKIGVKDSKLLSDKRCRELAGEIRQICPGKFEEVEISPDRYNELYEELKKV